MTAVIHSQTLTPHEDSAYPTQPVLERLLLRIELPSAERIIGIPQDVFRPNLLGHLD